MKTDSYTKFILTVIAICLSINVGVQLGFFPVAYATTTATAPELSTEYAVVPISNTNTMDVRIVDINTYDELNVNLKSVDTYDEVKVNLKSIDTSDELDVNLDEIGGGWISNGGPIPVKIN